MTLESFAAETEKGTEATILCVMLPCVKQDETSTGAFSDEILGFIEPFFSDLAQRMDEVETQVEVRADLPARFSAWINEVRCRKVTEY
jgi:hypothetical protein